jgi:hypothetical protein
MIKGHVSHAFCIRVFFSFLFEDKEDIYLIFCIIPYFMGSRQMYLNRWTLDLCPKNDVSPVVQVWVFLPYLHLHYWNDESICSIGNSLVKYIDQIEPKDGMQACAHICLEFNIEKVLHKEFYLTLDN